MQRIIRPAILFCLVSGSLHHDLAAFADNWGHWRGPDGNGAALNASPPTEWSASKNIQWKVAVPGNGSSSPVVWDDRIFITTAVEVDGSSGAPLRGRGLPELEFRLLCFHRGDGRLLWSRTATAASPHEGTHETNGFASASPCTDGRLVFAHFGSRGLHCYTMDGDLKWSRTDFGKMRARNGFGEGSSPTLSGDRILVPWDHEGPSALYSLNAETGETVWKADRDEPTCWATPLVVSHNGSRQVIMNGETCARSYDFDTGRELWRCGGQTERPCASPVAADGMVFVGSGHRGSFLGAFRLDGTGDIAGTRSVAWTVDRDTPDIASPLLSSGRIYFHKGKSGQLSCVSSATGKPYYMASRLPQLGTIYASPVAAGGYVFLTDRNGVTVVIRDSERLEIVSTNQLGETVDATPAPVGNQLIIRGERNLFCISESRSP